MKVPLERGPVVNKLPWIPSENCMAQAAICCPPPMVRWIETRDSAVMSMECSQTTGLADLFPILFHRNWRARGLDKAVAAVDPMQLCAEYTALRRCAPRRWLAGKQYFVGHSGVPSTTRDSNRREEHTAIALVNLGRRWAHPEGGWFRLLDYQVPLKARQTDSRIGKIDLLGVTDRGRLMVIELKVAGLNGGRTDAPPLALMEGLRYAAIVEANLEIIAGEAERRFGAKVARLPPVVQLLAPEGWWRSWLELRAAGIWGPAFARLIAAVEAQTGLIISCMALEEAHVIQGSGGSASRYEHVPALYPVRPGDASPIGAALPPLASVGNAMSSYGVAVNQHLWTWATQHVAEMLDGGSRPGRPPVLKPEFADMNVLVPSDAAQRAQIRTAIRFNQRHRHFVSLRSSQALTQSVFGAISAAGPLDLLAGITAECGRPAFFTGDDHWKLEFEHNVATLGEPRPTSIDVVLSGPDRCVAIECKFTESEFGTCSRPRLRPGELGWCDGSYRVQEGRRNRCALAEIGIQYWDHLPGVFAWPPDRDHSPCPFGPVYQLARNALAAAVRPGGLVDPARGHALVVYDARNPSFQAGGVADRQWESTIAACRMPGLLRRISWQRLLSFLAVAPNLAWLIDELQGKYGLVAD